MATELAFAYVIDVTLLREPTSVLASIGCGVIFVGVVAAAGAKGAAKPATDTTSLAAAGAAETHAVDWADLGGVDLAQTAGSASEGAVTGQGRLVPPSSSGSGKAVHASPGDADQPLPAGAKATQ